jgi:hypothetical protein
VGRAHDAIEGSNEPGRGNPEATESRRFLMIAVGRAAVLFANLGPFTVCSGAVAPPSNIAGGGSQNVHRAHTKG